MRIQHRQELFPSTYFFNLYKPTILAANHPYCQRFGALVTKVFQGQRGAASGCHGCFFPFTARNSCKTTARPREPPIETPTTSGREFEEYDNMDPNSSDRMISFPSTTPENFISPGSPNFQTVANTPVTFKNVPFCAENRN